MEELTKTEEILLVAIWRLKDEAYGVKSRREVSKLIKKEFTYGNLYSALSQLTKKRYVIRQPGESTQNRRGNKKIFYTVTPEGLRALKSAREMNDNLWEGIPKYAFDEKWRRMMKANEA